jgi:aspartate/methionine/tyrosine aminotransferase
MKLAARMAQIEPFHVMELMARAQALEAEGRSIIHLEVGEPDFATADPILEAAQRLLSGGHVHYTAALGLRALREAISGFYSARYGLDISPTRAIPATGISCACSKANRLHFRSARIRTINRPRSRLKPSGPSAPWA